MRDVCGLRLHAGSGCNDSWTRRKDEPGDVTESGSSQHDGLVGRDKGRSVESCCGRLVLAGTGGLLGVEQTIAVEVPECDWRCKFLHVQRLERGSTRSQPT